MKKGIINIPYKIKKVTTETDMNIDQQNGEITYEDIADILCHKLVQVLGKCDMSLEEYMVNYCVLDLDKLAKHLKKAEKFLKDNI